MRGVCGRLTGIQYNDGNRQGCWHRFWYDILVGVHFYTPSPCAHLLILIPSYSCVGVWKNDHVEIIANDQGNRTTPSYVSFSESQRLIGDTAKNQVAMNPHNTYVYYHTLLSQCCHIISQCLRRQASHRPEV